MKMDIQSPKGQVTLAQERMVIAGFHKIFPNFLYAETDKDCDAVNDGVILNRKTNTIVAVCETKCRGASIEQLANDWKWEWLITHKKIERNAFLAREMRVFFTGILYLAHSNLLLMKQLYDGRTDKWLATYRTAKTTTRRNVNGGSATRENAFIDMRDANQFKLAV